MYFGTLVTQVRHEQEQETWKNDVDAVAVAAPGRWRALWNAIARCFA